MWYLAYVLGILFATPRPGTVLEGRRLCRQGQFRRGLELVIQAGLKGRPGWRREARRCLTQWIRSLAGSCRADGGLPARLANLKEVERRAAKIAMPKVARMAASARKRCLGRLPRLVASHCRSEPGPGSLGLAKKLLSGAPAGPARAALVACTKAWLDSLAVRCKVRPSLGLLAEAAQAVNAATEPAKAEARAGYEACARSAVRFGLASCDAGRYLEGRRLAAQALGRFGLFGGKDPRFESAMRRAIQDRCGRFFLRLEAVLAGSMPGVEVKMALRGSLVLTGPDDRLRGTFRVQAKVLSQAARSGQVFVQPKACVFLVSGKYNPKTGNVAWHRMGQPKGCVEVVQRANRGAARVTRETLVRDALAAARVLRTWTPASEGSQLAVTYKGPIGGQRTVRLTGKLVVERLEPVP